MTSILIVDDDTMVLESMKAFLETQDYTILCARDGNQALDIIQKEVIDIALIDIFMPNKGGFETITSVNKSIPIIAMSGVSSHRFEPLSFAESLGARASLTKPFHPNELLQAIQEITDA
ncbi:response regulator [Terasakiella sp. A23]|uniref:response regulator n=1 Tax=Terasakiella sp. FCG-A23 TaxID=3080561 RepID=UPI002954A9F6|nr:response regulator [Terasakiella sp. A23]MDV7338208.1 response regulator [Terasakiella sp. A23]